SPSVPYTTLFRAEHGGPLVHRAAHGGGDLDGLDLGLEHLGERRLDRALQAALDAVDETHDTPFAGRCPSARGAGRAGGHLDRTWDTQPRRGPRWGGVLVEQRACCRRGSGCWRATSADAGSAAAAC